MKKAVDVPALRKVYSPISQHEKETKRSLVSPPRPAESLNMIAPNLRHQMKLVDKKSSSVGNYMKDFEVLKELGKGSYGQVFLVKSVV